MDKLSIVIESLTKPRYEEDSVDRLNYHVTTLILLIAAFTIIAKEYGGDPIQCWLPAELASQKSWEQYAEDYCFVENTYYIPLEQNMPQSEKHRDERLITYYQTAVRSEPVWTDRCVNVMMDLNKSGLRCYELVRTVSVGTVYTDTASDAVRDTSHLLENAQLDVKRADACSDINGRQRASNGSL
uniref:Innexin n=1 Tax=Wuchereria bancrofti TaxID=6293 RepID=A0A1I8ELH1_WUCBA